MRASAFASTCAWHSALTIGGVTSPSHLPSHFASAIADTSHFAEAPASHIAMPGLYLHEPSQRPPQLPPASSLHSPWHMPEQLPAQFAVTPPIVSQLPPAHAEHSPSHWPLHEPLHSAATSSWHEPVQLPSHWKFGAVPSHSRVPIAEHSAATSAETSHEPSHFASIEPGSASTSHSAAAFAVTSRSASHFGGS